MIDTGKIKIGDRVKARTWTRKGPRTVTRVVTGFYNGRVTVSCFGYKDFVLYAHEIIEHYPAENRKKSFKPEGGKGYGVVKGGLPEGTVIKVRIPNSAPSGGSIEGYLGRNGKILIDGDWYSPNDIAYWGMPDHPNKTKLRKNPSDDVLASFKKNAGSQEQIDAIYDVLWKVDRKAPYNGRADNPRYNNIPQHKRLMVRNLEGEGLVLPSKGRIEEYLLNHTLKNYHEFRFNTGSYLHLTSEPRQLSPNERMAIEEWERAGGSLGRTALVSLGRGKESSAWGYESPEGPEKKIGSVKKEDENPNLSRPPGKGGSAKFRKAQADTAVSPDLDTKSLFPDVQTRMEKARGRGRNRPGGNMYIRTTYDEYEIQGNYGQGWEAVCAEETHKEA